MLEIESLDSEEYFRDPEQDKPSVFGAGAETSGVDDEDDEPDDEEEDFAEPPVVSHGAGMNIVTNMTQGVRDPNRVNVFINGRFDFSLDVAQVVDFQLKVGRRLNAEQLQELRRASEFGKLYQRALEWALTRPHSLKEARDYLKRRKLKRVQLNQARAREEKRPLSEFDDATLELVFGRLVERGYLDDQKFAEYYVENRFTRKGASQRRLRSELMKKGVPGSIIANVLEESPRDEQDELQKAIAKKRSRYNNSKLLAYLVRQGFEYQMAKDAIERSSDEPTPEA